MPLPFLVGAAVVAAGVGIKKGLDAKEKNERANEIVYDANLAFKKAKERLENERKLLNRYLDDFAKFKLLIFTTQIKNLVSLLKHCKNSVNSILDHENIIFTEEEVKKLKVSVSNSIEIISGLEKGLQAGVLTAFGAYGSVGVLASASTGTAISTLSGAAATNATLAWLGGGSLAAGGFGMAGGMAVLGGLVAGPAIAITGLIMDSQAEENLTKAYEYESEVEKAIEKIEYSIEGFRILHKRIDELGNIINELANRFDNLIVKILNTALTKEDEEEYRKCICGSEDIDKLLIIGKNLKMALDIPLLDKDGNNNENFVRQIRRIEI
ncbi:MAG: hypothetical protein DSY46_07240 [Hydrogenimonas sp.]|nr:MAG: hypothetical protein DSY46_07240 [Hydrogenimonas sp.]